MKKLSKILLFGFITSLYFGTGACNVFKLSEKISNMNDECGKFIQEYILDTAELKIEIRCYGRSNIDYDWQAEKKEKMLLAFSKFEKNMKDNFDTINNWFFNVFCKKYALDFSSVKKYQNLVINDEPAGGFNRDNFRDMLSLGRTTIECSYNCKEQFKDIVAVHNAFFKFIDDVLKNEKFNSELSVSAETYYNEMFDKMKSIVVVWPEALFPRLLYVKPKPPKKSRASRLKKKVVVPTPERKDEKQEVLNEGRDSFIEGPVSYVQQPGCSEQDDVTEYSYSLDEEWLKQISSF
jgi:hypothetical protein